MRVLFFGCPGFGHVIPQLPLARAMRDRGDEVAVVAASSFGRLVEAERLPLLAAGPDVLELVVELKRSTGVDILAAPPTPEVEAEIFADARIDLGYEDALDTARSFKPDLIVVDAFDYVGRIVAAALDVPYAILSLGTAQYADHVAVNEARSARSHAARGLSPHAARWYLDTCPPSLQASDWPSPEGRLALRPEAYTGGHPVPAPSRDRLRPRVLVSFGTLFVVPEVISPIVQALLAQDLDIRVTLGPLKTAGDFDLPDARVEFAPFTPLAALLVDVDAVVTVGGAGAILGALAEGIPMVLTPMGADQPLHAGAAAAAGTGIMLPVGEPTPDAVADSVKALLMQSRYKEAAQRVAGEIAAMPAPPEVAAQLAAEVG